MTDKAYPIETTPVPQTFVQPTIEDSRSLNGENDIMVSGTPFPELGFIASQDPETIRKEAAFSKFDDMLCGLQPTFEQRTRAYADIFKVAQQWVTITNGHVVKSAFVQSERIIAENPGVMFDQRRHNRAMASLVDDKEASQVLAVAMTLMLGDKLAFEYLKLPTNLQAKEDDRSDLLLIPEVQVEGAIARVKEVTVPELEGIDKTIWDTVTGSISSYSDLVLFSEWLKERRRKSTDGSVIPLMQFLAIDTVDRQYTGRIYQLVAELCSSSSDEMRRSFLSDLVNSNTTFSNTFVEWAKLFAGDMNEAVERTLSSPDKWPKAMTDNFERHLSAKRNSIFEALERTLKDSFRRINQVPKPERTWAAWKERFLDSSKISRVSKPSPRKRRETGRTTPKTNIPVSERDITIPENTLASASIIGSSIEWNTDKDTDVEVIIRKFLKGYNDEALEADIRNMVDYVVKTPFGVAQSSFSINKSFGGYRIRSLTTSKATGLSTSTALAKDARILYTTRRLEDGSVQVGIIDILRHDDYMRFLKRVLSS